MGRVVPICETRSSHGAARSVQMSLQNNSDRLVEALQIILMRRAISGAWWI